MRSSNLFSKTLREAPSDAETISHQLLIRSGFIQQIASGIFSLLPLGNRSISKIRNIIREEMNNIGAQEVNLPVVQPRDIWEESGRANSFSPPLASFIDRRERQMVLAPTHEEAVTIMARANVKSYKDLPFILYQIQTKFRDEPRPRGGLLRVREFEMKDAYSFDIDEEGLDKNYNFVINAYKNIFNRCGIKVEIVEADSGGIGGKDSNEFVMLTDSGEDIILLSDRGDYAANIEKAVFEKEPNSNEEILDISEIYTPNIKSIQELSIDQNISKSKTLKSLLYSSEEKSKDSLLFIYFINIKKKLYNYTFYVLFDIQSCSILKFGIPSPNISFIFGSASVGPYLSFKYSLIFISFTVTRSPTRVTAFSN